MTISDIGSLKYYFITTQTINPKERSVIVSFINNKEECYDLLLIFMRSLDDGRPRWWALDFDENSESMLDGLDIYLAKQFWRFAEFVRDEDLEIRRSVFARFVNHQNKYIGLVAMIESLPVSIWRRILWRYNINFESFDLFFKRLSDEEEFFIRKNYKEFMRGDVPSVLTAFERRLEKFQLENLKREPEDSVVRFKSKGTWTYDFLNLGLGFNAYEDDSIVKNNSSKTWRDFIKVKNHIDDFVVNQEFGRYFWLYKTARSNYGWKRNKDVRLKSHICPGFWWTFIVHFFFWFLSPATLVGTIFISQTSYKLLSYILLPIAMITPLWCLSAIIWTVIRMALPESKRRKVFDLVIESIDKIMKNEIIVKILTSLGVAVIIVCALAATAVITYTMFILCFAWLDKFISLYLAVPLFVLLTPYIIHQCWCLATTESFVDHYNLYPIVNYFYFLIIPVGGLSFIVFILPSLIDVLGVIFGLGFIFTLSLLAILLPIPVYFAYSKIPDEVLAKFSELFTLISFGLLAIGIFGFLHVLMSIYISLGFWKTLIVVLPFLLILLIASRVICLIALYEPSIEKRYKKNMYFSNYRIVDHVSRWQIKWLIRKNNFLQGLNSEKQLKIIDKTEIAAYQLFAWNFVDRQIRVFVKMLPLVNSEEALDELIEKTKKIEEVYKMDERVVFFLVEGIFIHGLSFDEALSWGRDKQNELLVAKKKRERTIKMVLSPFVWFFRMIAQIKWLKDYFEKMCPTIKEERVLKL